MMKKINKNLFGVVKILFNEEFITGTEIGKKLNISRTAVWKIIKILSNYGVDIITDNQLGYKIKDKILLLDQDTILKGINFNSITLDIFQSVVSTNEYLKSVCDSGYQNHVCLSEYQSGGNARLGRNWYSPFAQNIYLSIKHKFRKDISAISGLSLVLGISIIKSLLSLNLPNKFLIKWPNDIYYEDKKILGILTEVIGESNGDCNAIIGIGLNVNMMHLPNSNNINWTSLKKITGENFDRNEICVLLINNIIRDLEKFNILGFQYYLDEWKYYDYLAGKQISVTNHNNVIEGEYIGIDEGGNLLIKDNSNKIITLYSGDTSIVAAN